MNENKEVQEAKRLIQEGKVKEGINYLFGKGMVQEALEETRKIAFLPKKI